MNKTIWTQTYQEFIAKWGNKKDLDLQDISDMLSDLLAIIQNLEKRI